MKDNKKANRLLAEKSPYLLQHSYNPVQWYPWCEEAFEKAKAEDKPIFLSIGYSTCHWCHVMAHESFEDEEVAEILNKYFVSIKVDREERPDIDSVYMTVCLALTGQGGWPLTILMTPEQKPFYAGTYFPKKSRYNMPGLIDVLLSAAEQWSTEKERLKKSGDRIIRELNKFFVSSSEKGSLSKEILSRGYDQLSKSFDAVYGGFGSSPKFPVPHKLMFLLRYYKDFQEPYALEMVEKTLEGMYKGGIFDHIAGGFSRYSVDRKWLVPHFEKMLYDNALLTIAYLEAYELTGNELYKNVAVSTLNYIFNNLTSKEGGFFCAEDADSEGEEGKYYLFSQREITDILGEEDGEYFNEYFDISLKGNFEGRNIPNLLHKEKPQEKDAKITKITKKLQEYRSKRYSLNKDDKILTSWNGLILAALGLASRLLGDDIYLSYGENAVNFIFKNLIDSEGRLMARYRERDIKHKAYLEDYAFLVYGLIELYEASYNINFLSKAITLTEQMMDIFLDKEQGGYYLYGNDGERLIARPKELYDGAIPSGNSVIAFNLIRLARLTGRADLEEEAEKQLSYMAGTMEGYEMNYSFFLTAASLALGESRELVCVLKDKQEEKDLIEYLRGIRDFNITVVVKNQENKEDIEELLPFTKEYDYINGEAAYYLCKGNVCLEPVNKLELLKL